MKKIIGYFMFMSLLFSFGCKKTDTRIIIETNFGKIEAELYPEKSPVTVKNFLRYVDEKFYDGTIFHRVLPGMLIEGGGYTPGMKIKPCHEPILNEATNGLSNLRGTIAMARTREIHSSTSQFFINVDDNTFLDHGHHGYGYCVFGKVMDMDIVDKIKNQPTKIVKDQKFAPITDVVIQSIKRKKIF